MSITTFTEVVRTLTRPAIALAFTGMFIGAVFTGHIDQIPTWLRDAGILAVGWWFIDRTVQRVINGGK